MHNAGPTGPAHLMFAVCAVATVGLDLRTQIVAYLGTAAMRVS